MIILWPSFVRSTQRELKKEGWYHAWAAGKKPWREKMAMTLHDCPDFYVDNEGRFTNPTWVEWMVNIWNI